jgi:hypothetical protein
MTAVAAEGAGVSMARDGGLREPLFATDPASDELQELQFTLGQGPCMEAMSGQGAVLVADVSRVDSQRRWPLFAPAAADQGVRGMFSFPVQSGAIRFGVLDVYRRDPGSLSADQLTDALLYADAVLVLALDGHRGDGSMERLLDAEFVGRQAAVHQAAGMVSVQLGVSITDGLARLRGYAFGHDRRLGSVAADVVARRLRFRPDTDPPGTLERDDGDIDPSPGTTKEADS